LSVRPEKGAGPDATKAFWATFAEEDAFPQYGLPDRGESVDATASTSVGKINKIQLRNACRQPWR
jgi:non-ribosomal peptide synthetase component E (peptide arylation enzyme)